MKRVCLAVTLWMALSAPLYAAQPKANIKVAPPVSNIQALKSIRFPNAPSNISKAQGAQVPQADPLATDVISGTPVNTNSSQVYKAASGLTLRPYSLSDNATGSYAVVDYIQINSFTISQIQNRSDLVPLSVGIPKTQAGTCAVFWRFMALPSGAHTYVLTLGATPMGNTASQMTINIGNQSFGPDKVLYSNGAFRVLFTYDAGAQGNNNSITGSAYINCNNSSGGLDFYYLQLAQLD